MNDMTLPCKLRSQAANSSTGAVAIVQVVPRETLEHARKTNRALLMEFGLVLRCIFEYSALASLSQRKRF